MTEAAKSRAADWVPVLERITRASGHELRNALNALVVNLEVVRSGGGEQAVRHFVNQSVAGSEESVRLAESVIALLTLVVAAIGDDGEVRCELVSRGAVSVANDGPDAERTARALAGLASRGVLGVDTTGSAVILSIPDATPRELIRA